jgi:nucleotide-binding universal stress UspA family protein
VDDTPASQRELQYVADMLQNREDITLYLLHVFPDPPPDYYSQGGTLSDYTQEHKEQAAEIFKHSVTTLSHKIDFQHITTTSVMAEGRPLSRVILDKQKEYQCNTVVLGKRGISKEEEFLFGSVSNTVVRSSHNFAVWIIS